MIVFILAQQRSLQYHNPANNAGFMQSPPALSAGRQLPAIFGIESSLTRMRLRNNL
jgi:hypothetical protein